MRRKPKADLPLTGRRRQPPSTSRSVETAVNVELAIESVKTDRRKSWSELTRETTKKAGTDCYE